MTKKPITQTKTPIKTTKVTHIAQATTGSFGTKIKADHERTSPKATYIANIHATYNNTIISISDKLGNVISIASGGSAGFKGARRNSAYAAQCAAELVVRRFINYITSTSNTSSSASNMQNKHVTDVKIDNTTSSIALTSIIARANGFGKGREAALRGLAAQGIKIIKILDVTPVAHNGCKPPKMRRL